MFRDTAIPFPGDKYVLGRYLGPSIDIGPAMTAKILKENGQVVHRSTVRGLTPEEEASEETKQKRSAFDMEVSRRLGPSVKWEDLFAYDVETPHYDQYEDKSGEHHEHARDADEPTP